MRLLKKLQPHKDIFRRLFSCSVLPRCKYFTLKHLLSFKSYYFIIQSNVIHVLKPKTAKAPIQQLARHGQQLAIKEVRGRQRGNGLREFMSVFGNGLVKLSQVVMVMGWEEPFFASFLAVPMQPKQ